MAADSEHMSANDQPGRDGRNGKEYSRYTRYFSACEQSEENQEWMNADSGTHQSRSQNVVLKNAIADNERKYPQQVRILGQRGDDDDDERRQ